MRLARRKPFPILSSSMIEYGYKKAIYIYISGRSSYESVQSGRHECGRPGRDVYGAGRGAVYGGLLCAGDLSSGAAFAAAADRVHGDPRGCEVGGDRDVGDHDPGLSVLRDHDGVLSGGDVRLRRDRDGVLLSEARIGAPHFWDDRGRDVFRDAFESSGYGGHDGDALGSGVWKYAGSDAGDGEGNVRSHGVRGSAGSGESADGGNDQNDPKDDPGGDDDGADGARLGGDADREGGFPPSGADGFSAVSSAGALAFPALGTAAPSSVCRDAVHANHRAGEGSCVQCGRGVLLRAVDSGDRDALVAAAYLSGGEAAASAHCHHFDLDPSPAAFHGVSWRGRYGAELSEEERV